MHKTVLTLICFTLLALSSCGQNEKEKPSLVGHWTFEEVVSEQDCPPPSRFALTEIRFTEDRFTLIGDGSTVTGDYTFKANELKMYNAMKDGEPQPNEEILPIAEITDTELKISLPLECPLTVIFKRSEG